MTTTCPDCLGRKTTRAERCLPCTRAAQTRQALERITQIREEKAAGATATEIAANLGLSIAALSRNCYRYGAKDLARWIARSPEPTGPRPVPRLTFDSWDSPDVLAGGRWVKDGHGVKRWVADGQAA